MPKYGSLRRTRLSTATWLRWSDYFAHIRGCFASTIHPYPTQAEVLRKLGDSYNRTRLTPTVKRLFERMLAWRR